MSRADTVLKSFWAPKGIYVDAISMVQFCENHNDLTELHFLSDHEMDDDGHIRGLVEAKIPQKLIVYTAVDWSECHCNLFNEDNDRQKPTVHFTEKCEFIETKNIKKVVLERSFETWRSESLRTANIFYKL